MNNQIKYKLTVLLLLFIFVNNLLAQKNKTFLLKPTGQYEIGTKELVLIDSSRKEKLKVFNKNFRKLYVKVWYPAVNNENANFNKYLSGYTSKTIYNIFKSNNISLSDVDSIKNYDTNSCYNIGIANNEDKYPVILFNSGFYFGMVDLYSCLMEEFASNGYIVFSIIHPYQQPLVKFPDGTKAKLLKKKAGLTYLQYKLKEKYKIEDFTSWEIIEKYTKTSLKDLNRFDAVIDLWNFDNQFVLDCLFSVNTDTSSFFYSKLDLNKIGMFGQSVGGAAAGQLCFDDDRVKAGANLDCFQLGDIIDNDLKTPFMVIESEYQKKWNIGNNYIYSNIKSDFYSLLFLNSSHFITNDAPLFPVLTKKQRERFYGKVNEKTTLKKINSYLLNFFNLYLKNIPSELLQKNISNSDIIYKVRN